MEKDDGAEQTSAAPEAEEKDEARESAAVDVKESFDSIINNAAYTFLNATGRLPTINENAAAALKRKAGMATVDAAKAVQKPSISPNVAGHAVELVPEILSEDILINDHDILADEIVELVSQTLQLSKGDQSGSDVFCTLKSTTVN